MAAAGEPRGAVLGIDAAWTLTNPSGVALVVQRDQGWELAAAESSYQRFLACADPGMAKEPVPCGCTPPVDELLAAAERLAGRLIDLVAVDMPLSRQDITGRRAADNMVTRQFSANWAATHSPTQKRPGSISDRLREQFEAAGYALATQAIAGRALIEVYPHVALLRLSRRDKRLPYKVGKIYSKDAAAVRRDALYTTWREIIDLLEARIGGVAERIRPLIPATGWRLKAAEDILDAIVCAWVGIEALAGRAEFLGDDSAAIWFPRG